MSALLLPSAVQLLRTRTLAPELVRVFGGALILANFDVVNGNASFPAMRLFFEDYKTSALTESSNGCTYL